MHTSPFVVVAGALLLTGTDALSQATTAPARDTVSLAGVRSPAYASDGRLA
ncbi:MAG: hypothetical protein IT353_04225, partial [Gemmatimonadaceae bacterium]|nr:hypothetical protein [Gemmatimonadaceae bacterium]